MSPTMTGEHGPQPGGSAWVHGPSGQPVQGSAGALGRRQGHLDHPQRLTAAARMGGSLRVAPSAPRRTHALEGRAYLAGEDNCIVFDK